MQQLVLSDMLPWTGCQRGWCGCEWAGDVPERHEAAVEQRGGGQQAQGKFTLVWTSVVQLQVHVHQRCRLLHDVLWWRCISCAIFFANIEYGPKRDEIIGHQRAAQRLLKEQHRGAHNIASMALC